MMIYTQEKENQNSYKQYSELLGFHKGQSFILVQEDYLSHRYSLYDPLLYRFFW